MQRCSDILANHPVDRLRPAMAVHQVLDHPRPAASTFVVCAYSATAPTSSAVRSVIATIFSGVIIAGPLGWPNATPLRPARLAADQSAARSVRSMADRQGSCVTLLESQASRPFLGTPATPAFSVAPGSGLDCFNTFSPAIHGRTTEAHPLAGRHRTETRIGKCLITTTHNPMETDTMNKFQTMRRVRGERRQAHRNHQAIKHLDQRLLMDVGLQDVPPTSVSPKALIFPA